MTEWRQREWGDIATLEYGKAFRDYRNGQGSTRVFGTNGPIGFTSLPSHSDGPGVIVGRKGAYRGIHFADGPFAVIDTAFWLKPTEVMDLRWAYYELLTHDINAMDSGSAIPSTSRDAFYRMPVLVPPIGEQRAIAATLSALDYKVDSNHRTMDLAWSLLESQWIALARGARRLPLGEVLSLSYGKALPASIREAGDVPVYGSNGITGWHRSSLVPGPAVIVGRKGSIGEVHWSPSAAYPIDTTFYVNPINAYPLIACFFALKSAGLASMNSDSAIPGLNRDRALNVEVPLPERPLLNAWAAEASKLLDFIAARKGESDRLIALRDALLPGLLSGRLAISTEAAG